MIYLGKTPIGLGVEKTNLLRTLTFVDANGEGGRQTVTPDLSWNIYDTLLLIPDITVSAQDGETNGNWLWMGIQRNGTTTKASNYNSVGTVGKRDIYFMATLCKGWQADRYYWRFGFTCDRGATMPLINNQDINSENFSDLSITYGPYYGATYGILNGTLKIYGVKLK